MLLSLYQIFIFLLGHLHSFLHFFFSFMENLFKKHPILVPKFYLSASSSSFFLAFFYSRLWRTFLRNTLYKSALDCFTKEALLLHLWLFHGQLAKATNCLYFPKHTTCPRGLRCNRWEMNNDVTLTIVIYQELISTEKPNLENSLKIMF